MRRPHDAAAAAWSAFFLCPQEFCSGATNEDVPVLKCGPRKSEVVQCARAMIFGVWPAKWSTRQNICPVYQSVSKQVLVLLILVLVHFDTFWYSVPKLVLIRFDTFWYSAKRGKEKEGARAGKTDGQTSRNSPMTPTIGNRQHQRPADTRTQHRHGPRLMYNLTDHP